MAEKCTGSTVPDDGMPWRKELALQLDGHGVEFGPGPWPLALGKFVKSIRYCDVHPKSTYAALFPDCAELMDRIPDPDFLLHFDRDDFASRIGKGSLDFVIANHVLEHLANPVGFLRQCYDLLKPDGMMYLGLPDKRKIFDRYRRRTLLSELLRRHEDRCTAVPDEAIRDFVCRQHDNPNQLISSSPNYRAIIESERTRSIHANVWILDDIIELLTHLGRKMDTPWRIVDGQFGGIEFILLLQKSDCAAVCDLYGATTQRIHADFLSTKLDVVYGTLASSRSQSMAKRLSQKVRRLPLVGSGLTAVHKTVRDYLRRVRRFAHH